MQQLDLFAGSPASVTTARIDPAALSDAALVATSPHASQTDAPALAAACISRKPPGAVEALEELCRRFKGFGLHATVSEQRAALAGLRGIGGRPAGDAVVRLLAGSVVQGPGLAFAVAVAAALDARLPEPVALTCLRHSDPAVRADACRCVRVGGEIVPVLIDLLADLHPAVADAAASALGRAGRPEGRTRLIDCLLRSPSVETIQAFGPIADDDGVVVLGRLARSHPSLADAVLEALDSIDTERAAVVAAGVRRRFAQDGVPC